MTTVHRFQTFEIGDRIAAVAHHGLERLESDPVAKTLVAGTIDRASYGHFLTQTFHQIHDCAGPMLATAGQNLAAQGKYPRVSAILAAKEDEGTHDVWALNDALSLGIAEATVRDARPCPAVLAYRAYTSYLARHQSLGVVGVAFVLETLGCELAGKAAANLVAYSGIPGIERAVSFLAGHGEEDQSHVRILSETLADVRDPRDCAVIELAAKVTVQLYLDFFHVA